MDIIGGILGVFSPRLKYERKLWKQALKNYDAAKYDRLNRNWIFDNGGAEVSNAQGREALRQRARDLEKNSDFFQSVLNAYLRNVIGSGYNLQARTESEEINTVIESLWQEWCKRENCDITGMQSLNQILRMVEARKRVDGGVFLRLVNDSEYKLIPLKLQCIEVDELDTSVSTAVNKDCKVFEGIELNEYNKPTGYHFKLYKPDGSPQDESIYVPANEVIYYFTKKRPSQIREITDFAHSMIRIKNINEYMEAIAVKERVTACLSAFITKQGGGNIGRSPIQDNSDYSQRKLEPGLITYLNPGESVNAINPAGQGSDVNQHIKIQEKILASGQGLSYETVSRDMSETNYSSARQGLIEDEQTYIDDKESIMGILSEIYTQFLTQLELSRLITLDLEKPENLLHEWIRRPKAWIDPLKEANANKVALETNQKTFKQICAENGRDWKDVLRDMKEVKDEAKSLGINIYGLEDKKEKV